jgi:hypothetical protein
MGNLVEIASSQSRAFCGRQRRCGSSQLAVERR